MAFLHEHPNLGLWLHPVSSHADVTAPSVAGDYILYWYSGDEKLYAKDHSDTHTAVGSGGSGAGDFLADGSVPMTGDLQMGNQIVKDIASLKMLYSSGTKNGVLHTDDDGQLVFTSDDITSTRILARLQEYYFQSYNTSTDGVDESTQAVYPGATASFAALPFNLSSDNILKNNGSLSDGTDKFTAPLDGIYTFHASVVVYQDTSTAGFEGLLRQYNGDGSVHLNPIFKAIDAWPSTNSVKDWSFDAVLYMIAGESLKVLLRNTDSSGANNATAIFRNVSFRPEEFVSL